MNNNRPEWFLYVRKFSIFTGKYELYVYQTFNEDVYHTMGEMVARSIEDIKRIDFCKWTGEKKEFWIERNIEIRTWKDIHKNI